MEFCAAMGYTMLNSGEPTRRGQTTNKGADSAPHASLSRGCIAREWTSAWHPDSDHFLITFEVVIGQDVLLVYHTAVKASIVWGRALAKLWTNRQAGHVELPWW